MGQEAGLVILSYPALAATTDAAFGADQIDTTGDKVFIITPVSLDIVEVGCLITVTTGADTLIFKVSTAPATGGSYTDVATVTGPTATAITAGKRLKKYTSIHLNAGDVLRFNVTDAAATNATGVFYALGYPTGDPYSTADDVISTT